MIGSSTHLSVGELLPRGGMTSGKPGVVALMYFTIAISRAGEDQTGDPYRVR